MRQRLRLVLAVLAVTVFCEALEAQGAVELLPVGDGIWAVRRAYVGSNAAVIVGTEGVVVVDSHVTPAAARDTLAAIREITDAPVRFLIDTHWHTDHSAGATAYRDAFPELEVISHHSVPEDLQRFGPEQMEISITYVERALEQAEDRLAGDSDPWEQPWSDGRREALRRFVAAQRQELSSLDAMEFLLPTLTIEQELIIHRAEGPIQVLFLGRGHTRGDVVALLPEQKVLVAGDLVTAPRLHIGNHSRPTEWLGVLETIEQLDFEHIIPGHGEVLSGKGYLHLVTRALRWVVDRVRKDLGEGLGLSEIASRITLDQLVTELSEGRLETKRALERMGPMVEDAVGFTYLELTGKLDE